MALVGMRASGKTTLAAALAGRLGWDAVDTDELLARRVGRPAGDHLAEVGEAAFRAVELEVCRDALASADRRVVALGGGAVLHAEVRADLCADDVFTVFLAAPVERLVARQRAASTRRPALTDLPVEQEVRALLAARLPLYLEVADLQVETFPANVDACCARISAKMGRAR